jgi:hypothetical protein
MGQLPLPDWNSRTSLLRAPNNVAVAMVDPSYHPRLSQPSNRAIDAELAASSMNFDPAVLGNALETVKIRPTSRVKHVTAIRNQSKLLEALRAQERALLIERDRLLAMEPHRRAEPRVYSKSKPRSKIHGKGKGRLVRSKGICLDY